MAEKKEPAGRVSLSVGERSCMLLPELKLSPIRVWVVKSIYPWHVFRAAGDRWRPRGTPDQHADRLSGLQLFLFINRLQQ